MNKRYNDLRRQGYQTTGLIASEYRTSVEEMKARAQKHGYYTLGNKVAIVKQTEESHFRGRPDRTTYLVVMVLFSEAYLAQQKAEQEKRNKEHREWQLRKLADQCTLEELAWMMKDKLDRMTTKELVEVTNG